MAPRVTPAPTDARAGRPWPDDPWHPRPPLRQSVQRGKSLLRRALNLALLLVLCVLGALLLVPLLALLGIGTASGSDVAGWLLGFTLLLVTLGAVWTVRRASRLISGPDEAEAITPDAPTLARDDEASLLAVLRAGERALPAPARSALHGAVLATRDALRLTAGDATLGREAFDARQAAREDLPELLRTYQAAPRTPETERLFLEQLGLIEQRMTGIVQERRTQQTRTLQAQHRYLESKYGEGGKTGS